MYSYRMMAMARHKEKNKAHDKGGKEMANLCVIVPIPWTETGTETRMTTKMTTTAAAMGSCEQK